MNILKNFVILRLHVSRAWNIVQFPVQLGTFFLALLLNIRETGNDLYWLAIPALAILGLAAFFTDKNHLLTEENEYIAKKTPTWVEQKRGMAQIEKEVKEIKELLKNGSKE